jgi:hypothetical protein
VPLLPPKAPILLFLQPWEQDEIISDRDHSPFLRFPPFLFPSAVI